MYYTIFNCIKSIPKLFYRNTLGKVSGLINVEALGNTDVVAKKLKWNNRKASDKVLINLRYIYREINAVFNIVLAVSSDDH